MHRRERRATSDAAVIPTVLGLWTFQAQHYEPWRISVSFIFASSCPISVYLKNNQLGGTHELLFLTRKIKHKADPRSGRNSPHTVFAHYSHALASRCSTYLAQWIIDRFGPWISYKYPPKPPSAPAAPRPSKTTCAHSSSTRRVEAAFVLKTELLSLAIYASNWLLSICGYYLGPYVKTNNICLTSATSFHPDALQMVHLVIFPLWGEPLVSVGAGTKSIKAYCILEQLSPLAGR